MLRSSYTQVQIQFAIHFSESGLQSFVDVNFSLCRCFSLAVRNVWSKKTI